MGMVGQVMLFSIGVMFFTGNMILMNASGDQNVFDSQVSTEIEYQLANVKMNSVMTVIQEDYMWRADEIGYEKYGNMKFKKIVSLYFSTDSDNLYIGGEAYEATGSNSVEQDIEDYVEMKMDRYFLETTDPANYSVQISGRGDRQPINVGPGFEGSGSQRTYSMPVTNGEEVFMTVLVEDQAGVFGVAPSEE